MSRCASCNREPKPGVACTLKVWNVGGRTIPRIPRDARGNCAGCGCPEGEYHHPGCVVEVLPAGVTLEISPCL